ncbi:hypothetical protein S7711_08705 [Stachybotrys chartarum IBT 7711]|uniref:Mechanosensitive ion channel protein n=1 Tax=Stachybotrys chartarum (strain CBS 109288 / IBT 7711) TaxID=1280523 RepID=A0A084AFA1_STACB|nr:hypothetical protein S7711_08705 [Stachybotrys chartarum IBT 7711]KFA46427.1 hypothetical protein S40293_04274 [Stachybotrys chartarum IBT 40293]KFA77772.1 hypothetical protein S40288_00499 [Stachybotrys chartarum IBT 40288]
MASSSGPNNTHGNLPLQAVQQDIPLQDIDERHEYGEKKEKNESVDTSNTLTIPLHPTFSHDPRMEVTSPTSNRADMNRLNDDLELLRAERLISHQENTDTASRLKRGPEPDDTFNHPVHKETMTVKRKDTDALLYKFWCFLKKFPRFIRYLVYLLPGAGLLLIPVLLGRANGSSVNVGGVSLMWFGIWLQIVWGALWVSRMVTSLMPPLFYALARIAGSVNAHKWKDIGQQLELHTALFFWMLAVLVSYDPMLDDHVVDEPNTSLSWIRIVERVIIAIFVLATLNWLEKICIQWIATSFHQRTYATRIENHKGDVRQLVHLYEYAKTHLESSDPFWQGNGNTDASGSQTPMRMFQDNAKQVLGKVGYVANRVGNDFMGRKVTANHPRRVVTELLRTTSSAHTLARLIYRSLVQPDQEHVSMADVRAAFATEEEAMAAFSVFDKDLNGDISLDEFEAVCNEISLEKKAIAASLKDLDSVIKRLDHVFFFIICVISIIVFISIISGSAAAGLASAGTSVLGLAWMLQATAQEFLQSIIFVFVKHPFDVGDRVTIYGSTGATLTGDDYYVTEISLLYTEFKKMQGHIVQAPNSVLNTLFILNQRRSNGLADVVPLIMRFGTPAEMIEELKSRMLDFCLQNKRDYRAEIISEMVSVDEVRSCQMNLIFFHKSNWQNELLRLNRHNKFVTHMMQQMVEIGIQPPMRADAGGSRENPLYWTGMQPPPAYGKEYEQDHDHQPHEAHPGRPQRRPSVFSSNGSSVRPDRTESNMSDVQDVFESRKEHTFAQRLASIREKDRAARIEEEGEPRASTSALAPTTSHDNQSQTRSRIFGRARSSSRSQAHGQIV